MTANIHWLFQSLEIRGTYVTVGVLTSPDIVYVISNIDDSDIFDD